MKSKKASPSLMGMFVVAALALTVAGVVVFGPRIEGPRGPHRYQAISPGQGKTRDWREMMRARILLSLIMLMIVLSVAGCLGKGSPPPKYYTLTAVDRQQPMGASFADTGGPSVLLMPVNLPGYLDRQQIVSISGSNVVSISEFNRWAEPLSGNIMRVLARNLEEMIPSENVHTYPTNGANAEYVVSTDIIRFDGMLGRGAVLEAAWVVKANQGKAILGSYRALHVAPARDDTHEALVSAMSIVMEQLSQDMSKTIKTGGQADGPRQ